MNEIELMLDTHQILLAFTLIVLTSYSYYAGIIAPILSYSLKIKYWSIGYTNDSKLSLIIMSIMFSFVVTLIIIFSCINKYKEFSFSYIIKFFWEICDYWRIYKQFQIPTILFWYIYGSLFFIGLMNISFALVSRWPKGDYKQVTDKKDTKRHAFIVVAHNSSTKLKHCINSLLSIVEPHQIYIADNGSTREEQLETKKICKRYSKFVSDDEVNQLNSMLNGTGANTGKNYTNQILLIKKIVQVDSNMGQENDSNMGQENGDSGDGDSFKSCVEYFDRMENIDLNLDLDLVNQLDLHVSGKKISNINVAHLNKGNKTFAQYSSVLALSKWFSQGKSCFDIVTIIDDDVYVPEYFPFKDIENQFQDPKKVAIAYPLNIENSNDTLCCAFQEVEYYSGNVARYTQDLFGSQLFCSGAIATWKVDDLKNVLSNHCTTFNGEDLEMGYILHKEKKENPQRIGFTKICTVPTVAPYCWFHWYDFLPNPLKRKLKNCDCDCGEHSFFNQRLRSWDPANYQFFIKYAKVAFSIGGKQSFFIRCVCIWKMLGILREISLIVGILVPIFRIRDFEMFKVLFIFYVDSVGIAWCIAMIWTWFISFFSLSRQNYTLRPDIILWYPLLFEIPYMLIIRPLSAIYSLTYYIYFKKFPQKLKKQLESDPELKNDIEQAWDS